MLFCVMISLPFFGIGAYMVIGSLVGVKFLVEPPKQIIFFIPYYFLRRLGGNATKYYHILVGVLFMIASIFFAILLNKTL